MPQTNETQFVKELSQFKVGFAMTNVKHVASLKPNKILAEAKFTNSVLRDSKAVHNLAPSQLSACVN